MNNIRADDMDALENRAGTAPLPLFRGRSIPPLRALAAPPTLDSLRGDVERCRSCPLYAAATHAVFGEGPRHARLMLVGEQPGGPDDRAGRPFTGPAGAVLDQALAAAGIARAQVYVTHAVKHFKFMARGSRRVDQRPELHEVTACRSWLDHEVALVKPALIVALGAAAARALLGRSVVGGGRQFYALPSCVSVTVTVHPSDILRNPDRDRGAADYDRLVADLAAAQAHVDEMNPVPDWPVLAKAG
jgi:uracil-DNA glycosylase family protein